MDQHNDQTLTEHLEELRTRLLYSIYIVVVGFAAAWSLSEQLFDVIRAPIAPFLEKGLVFTGVMDKFIAHIKVSLLAGIIITCPFWLYQVWKFIAPGLYENERKYSVVFIFFGSLLFLTGVAFVYFVVYPQAFDFLMHFAGDKDTPMITIDRYLHFFMLTTLVFGTMFELPLVLTILGIFGIIDQEFLRSKRRFAIVILAALAAMVTPPDVISMVFMLVPLVLLYESSVFLVGWFGKKPGGTE